MAGWHHQCNEHKLGQTPRDGEGQGGLACCNPWGRKESNMTRRLNTQGRKRKEPMKTYLICVTKTEAKYLQKNYKL